MTLKNVEDIYPMTPMQRLMLLHGVANPESATLTTEVAFEIDGPLDTRAFRLAFGVLVERHEALRTSFLWEGLPQPLSVVRARVEIPFTEVHLPDGSIQDGAGALDDILQHHRGKGYDPAKAPLTRGTLVRLESGRHRFLWSAHHLVGDRWSYEILMDELRTIYEALVEDRPLELPKPGRFRDYVALLERRRGEEAETRWRSHLAGVKKPTPWVDGYTPVRGGPRSTTTYVLEAIEVQRLDARASLWRTTPATLILAATGLFLARRARTSSPVVGVTVSGRPPELPGVETTVGSFVNNLPLRLELRSADRLTALLRTLQVGQASLQAHDHVSLADLHDWSDLPAGERLFDGLVVLNLLPDRSPTWRDLEVRPVSSTLDAGYPWILEVSRTGSALAFKLVHDAVFHGAAELLAELGGTLMRLVDTNPEATVGDVLEVPRNLAESAVAAGRVEPFDPGPSADPFDRRPLFVQELLAVWREVLGRPSLGLDDDFFQLGGTSLQAARIFSRVERITGQVLPLSTLLRARSVRALLRELDEPLESTGPLVAIRSRGGLRPVLAVPGVGGNVVGLYPLARALEADRPFYGLQSRGLDGKKEPFDSIEAIADDFTKEAAPLAVKGVHLLGACWGAAVAFEVARRLQALGTPCLSLSLLDPPFLTRPANPVRSSAVRDLLLNRLSRFWVAFRTSDWRARGVMIRDKARRAASLLRPGGAAESLSSELSSRRVQAANVLAIQRYLPHPLSGRATVFLSQREWGDSEDPRLEWVELLDPRPRVIVIPGFDSGDAITARAEEFVDAFEPWLRSSEPVTP